MLKKLLLFALLCLPAGLRAQQAGVLNAAATSTCAAPGNSFVVLALANTGAATFTITANASANTISFFGSGDNQASWAALNVTASNAQSPVTTTTGTGVFQANVAGYTHVCMEISSFVSGTTTVRIQPGGPGASARAGGGSAFGTPPASPAGATQTACETPSGGVAGLNTWCLSGIIVTDQSGASYTVDSGTNSDRGKCLQVGGGFTYTIPDAGSGNITGGYYFCLQNTTSSDATINRTSSSTFTLLGLLGATLQTTFPLHTFQVAYFYTSPNNNWNVFVGGSGITASGTQAFDGSASITSSPPAGTTASNGWKWCWNGSINCFGGANQSGYFLLNQGGNAWLSLGGANPANNGGSVSPDASAGLSFYSTVFSIMGVEHAGCGFTNRATEAFLCANSTTHEYAAATNGSSSLGMLIRAQPGPVVVATQTAAISTATLCASAAGACITAGQYHVHWNMWGSGTACSNVAAGSVTFLLTWTDENAVVHSAVALLMQAQTGAATEAFQATFPFQTALANESASGDYTFSSNGSVIQYATGYVACTTGTGTYNLRATVTRLQ